MFDVKKHLIKVQGGRQYLPVAARLVWFRQEHPDWGIETRPVTIDIEKQFAVFEARVYNADGKLMATGTKMENVRGFPDFIEKAETGSIGRALAVCGYGTQFAPDLDETTHGRIVDSPQPVGRPSQQGSYGDSGYRSSRSYSAQNRYGGNGQPIPQPAAYQNGESRYAPELAGEPAERRPLEQDHAAPAATGPSDAENGTRSARSDDADDLFEAPSRAEAPAAADQNSCSACGKALNAAQQTLSVRKYGVALCPTCQKERRAVEA